MIPLTFFIIIGCMLTAGCATQTASSEGISTSVTPTPELTGPLSVYIGDYDARLLVSIDNISVGEVSKGKPFGIDINEGLHTVKVCDGSVCEEVDVHIKSFIYTTLDFGPRLIKNAPKGPLSVSIGTSQPASLPVFIDNAIVGNVSSDTPLSIDVREGLHTVKVCSGNNCVDQVVEIKSGNQTSLDFGEQLTRDVRQGPLSVSIGGYNANDLPVLIDGTNSGNVSQGKPLALMIDEGRHTVKVCLGIVCESEDVEIKFAQPRSVNFEERLKKDVEFPEPTVRIVNSVPAENSITINVEFINPDKTDLTMTATIGCGYSYIDYNSRERKNDFAQSQLTQFVKAGDRSAQQVVLWMTKGHHVIPSSPTVVELITK